MEVSKILNSIKSELIKKFPNEIEELWLFGSHARNEQTEASDVDIMIVHNSRLNWYDDLLPVTSDICYDIYNMHDVYCSFISTDSESFSEFRPLFNTIKREGLRL